MESKAKVFGHPIHTILIVFPLGLLTTSLLFDIGARLLRKPRLSENAFALLGAGLVGGLVSAPWGTWDWLAIRAGTRAKQIGLWHGLGNGLVLALFGASWLERRDAPEQARTRPLFLSLLGGTLAGVTGWLGGELLTRLGVGVDDAAHLNAPNSLSGRPAGDNADPKEIGE